MELRPLLAELRARGDLVEVETEVDPHLEMTEIACRLARERGPAVLFRRPKGSAMPVLLNLLGTPERLALALGRRPAEVAAEFAAFLQDVQPPSAAALWKHRGLLSRARHLRLRTVARAPFHEVDEGPDLTRIPALTCWPLDGGAFFTWPLVVTRGPERGDDNLGLYRMQVFGPAETGMHWQIGKGGAFHHAAAERLGEDLPVTVALGAEPLLLFAGMMPLPEGISELAFAGFLRGRPTAVWRDARGLPVPASAEIVLEGVVPNQTRRLEGPFGDHFGHYSAAAPFPVFKVGRLRRRSDAIYVAAVVGKPPQEDMVLGDAVQEMFLPILKLTRPEVRDAWAHYETGFHALFTVSMRPRYDKESLKTAFSLLGEGQVALTKVCIVVPYETDCRDASAVLRELGRRFDPGRDVLLLPHTSADTLDFTGPRLNHGSKMVIDLTGEARVQPPIGALPDLGASDPDVIEQALIEDAALLVRLRHRTRGRPVLERLLADPRLARVPLLVVLSSDVDLGDRVSWLWGWFTRFDPATDVLFRRTTLQGAIARHQGPMGIDATWKEGYPEPLEMPEEIVKRVSARWREYGFSSAPRSRPG